MASGYDLACEVFAMKHASQGAIDAIYRSPTVGDDKILTGGSYPTGNGNYILFSRSCNNLQKNVSGENDNLSLDIAARIKVDHPDLDDERIRAEITSCLARVLKRPRKRGRPRQPEITHAMELLAQGVNRAHIPWRVIPGFAKLSDSERAHRRQKLFHAIERRKQLDERRKQAREVQLFVAQKPASTESAEMCDACGIEKSDIEYEYRGHKLCEWCIRMVAVIIPECS